MRKQSSKTKSISSIYSLTGVTAYKWFANGCTGFIFIYLQGYIQDAYIVSGPNGYLKQCPNIETQCPTCGQYSNLLKTLDDLLKKVDDLTQRVSTPFVRYSLSVIVGQ